MNSLIANIGHYITSIALFLKGIINILSTSTMAEIGTQAISTVLSINAIIRSIVLSPGFLLLILISAIAYLVHSNSYLKEKTRIISNRKSFVTLAIVIISTVIVFPAVSVYLLPWLFSLLISWIVNFIFGIKSLVSANMLLVYFATKGSAISLTTLFSGFIIMSILISLVFFMPNFRFRAKNAVTSIVFLSLGLITLTGYPAFYPLPQITAKFVSLALNYTIGIEPLTYGNALFLNMDDSLTMIFISPECSGFILMSIFIVVIFLLPNIKTEHRVASILLLPLIYLANVFRIFMSVVVGIYTNVSLMTLVHDTIGQIFLMTFTIGLFVTYLVKLNYLKLRRFM